MELSFQNKQAQNQRQKLVLSEQMQESLKILQMSRVDLQRKIEEELTNNPALEYENPNAFSQPEEEKEDEKLPEIPKLWEEPPAEPYYSLPCGEESPDPFASISQDSDFREFLFRQLSEISIETSIEKICRYLIESLDEHGYLPYRPEKIARELHLPDAAPVRAAVKNVQRMDPAGVGAFDLRECLLLQLERKEECSPVVSTIVEQYLELVADNKIKAIAGKLDVSVEQAQMYCNAVRKLNPIPSRGFRTGTCERFVIPEAVIRHNDSGELCVEDYRTDSRRLFINPYYLKLAQTIKDEKTQVYLNDKIRKASSLILQIANRKKTILRILESIVRRQRLYFEKGTSALKPMSMKSIAAELGLHESTVSRAVQEKFILCTYGTVDIKCFFTGAVSAGDDGSSVSSAVVKSEIKEIVDAEDPSAPLSDQQIVEKLRQSEGNLVSRRTVAKYRDELHIPPSFKRRCYSVNRKV